MKVGPWIEVNKPIRDFHKDLVVGMQFEVTEYEGNVVRYLVGDVNEYCGSCDCCGRSYDTDVVIRYRMIDLTEDE